MFHGSIVALVTPMFKDGTLAIDSLRALVEWHIQEGTQGIVACGTTGEASVLTADEQKQVLRHVIEQVNGRIPVIAGTAANGTQQAINLSLAAMHEGADACLIMTPAYIKPTQEGLYLHYKAIAEAVSLPIILYNVPGRTACDLLPETVTRLNKLPNIVGIKEATGKLERVQEILALCNQRIDILSGDDETAAEAILAGAKGVISVTANVAPQLMYELCSQALVHDEIKVSKLNQRLMPLHQDLFLEANPIPVKWALYKMGHIPEGIRLPLTVLSEKYQAKVYQAMQSAGIIAAATMESV